MPTDSGNGKRDVKIIGCSIQPRIRRRGFFMPIGKLDHYSIRALDIQASRRFYTEVIELNFPAAEAQQAA